MDKPDGRIVGCRLAIKLPIVTNTGSSVYRCRPDSALGVCPAPSCSVRPREDERQESFVAGMAASAGAAEGDPRAAAAMLLAEAPHGGAAQLHNLLDEGVLR